MVNGEWNLVFPNGKGNIKNRFNIYRSCPGSLQLVVGITDAPEEGGSPAQKHGLHACVLLQLCIDAAAKDA
jgi:hypothetical protein